MVQIESENNLDAVLPAETGFIYDVFCVVSLLYLRKTRQEIDSESTLEAFQRG